MSDVSGTVMPGFEPVRDAFEANFRAGAEVGAAVSVYLHGREVVKLWGGTADPDTGRPWREDTLQVIYSATKSVPAACAHLLAQRGQLDLDAPVRHYWPEFAAAGASVGPWSNGSSARSTTSSRSSATRPRWAGRPTIPRAAGSSR